MMPSSPESGGRELPELVIQHIQGFQSEKDAVRSCLLSKSWLSAWSTKPTLCFKQTQKTQTYDDQFINSVHKTLVNYSDQNILLHRLSFFINSLDSNLALLLQNWLEIATERRVKEVHLYLSLLNQHQQDEEQFFVYAFPPAIFASKFLMVLKLAGGREHPKLQLMCLDDGIKSRSLTTLYLERVWLDTKTIENLIASFPLIEKLVVHECKGVDEIHVINLERLKHFSIETTKDHPVTVIEIEAPELLSSFTYKTPCLHHMHNTTYKSIAAFKNLKRLHLDLRIMKWSLIDNLANNFPSLEDLILDFVYGLRTMNIRSKSLKRLYLQSREITIFNLNIDAPGLCHLSYYGFMAPVLSFPAHTTTPTHLYTRIGVDVDVDNPAVDLDTAFFLILREFLTKVNTCKLVFVIGATVKSKLDIGDVEALRRAIPIRPDLQVGVVTLLMAASSPLVYTDLLEGLFWICHPTYIHLISFPRFRFESICVKLLCKKLVVETINPRCCSSREIKCWRHELIDVQIMTEEDETAAAEFDDGYESSTDKDHENEFEDKQVDRDEWWPLAFHSKIHGTNKKGIWQKTLGPNTKGIWLRFNWRRSTSGF